MGYFDDKWVNEKTAARLLGIAIEDVKKLDRDNLIWSRPHRMWSIRCLRTRRFSRNSVERYAQARES